MFRYAKLMQEANDLLNAEMARVKAEKKALAIENKAAWAIADYAIRKNNWQFYDKVDNAYGDKLPYWSN